MNDNNKTAESQESKPVLDGNTKKPTPMSQKGRLMLIDIETYKMEVSLDAAALMINNVDYYKKLHGDTKEEFEREIENLFKKLEIVLEDGYDSVFSIRKLAQEALEVESSNVKELR